MASSNNNFPSFATLFTSFSSSSLSFDLLLFFFLFFLSLLLLLLDPAGSSNYVTTWLSAYSWTLGQVPPQRLLSKPVEIETTMVPLSEGGGDEEDMYEIANLPPIHLPHRTPSVSPLVYTVQYVCVLTVCIIMYMYTIYSGTPLFWTSEMWIPHFNGHVANNTSTFDNWYS